MFLSADTGGTFTDFVAFHENTVRVLKVLSTPQNPAQAVLDGFSHFDFPRITLVHGSTVATNAILERKGARTALVTNRGFEDVIEIARQTRDELYALAPRRSPQLVPRERRFGIAGRIGCDGTQVEPLCAEEVLRLAQQIRQIGAESVAVCLLFSFANPSHELRVEKLLREVLGATWSISLSHQVMAEFREFERTSTTLVNAFVQPVMQRYLQQIDHAPAKQRLVIMQSNGGRISAATAMREPVRTILSGPAGGVVGAFDVARRAGFDKIITFDMGGTSTDVSLINGSLPLSVESRVAGHPLKVPMIEIHTVGAGGGSIARFDEGGALVVGPESAGADPGPICYGKGEQITVTDANLFLGRLVHDFFLGGEMQLHRERITPFFQGLARKAGLAPLPLAQGICQVANATMERALRVISVERGFDPGEFSLVSFGGAGGMHALFLASLLGIPRVIVPRNPGLLSALGMLVADVIRDYSQTVMATAPVFPEWLEGLFQPLEERARQDVQDEGIPPDQVRLERFLDMRYKGQSFELIVPLQKDVEHAFHEMHHQRYGYQNPGRSVEIVNVRLRATGTPEKPVLCPAPSLARTSWQDARMGSRPVCFSESFQPTPLLRRDLLHPGHAFEGPAIVVEYSSTLVIPPGWKVLVDPWENLLLSREEEREGAWGA
ncbi:MAG TPA: hydantoinase/oxoprolinase family protein [Thermotogota bacterium]|nr:hydantoinase/oxoprolinase family protein [Thermotogota bacterium]